MKLGTENRNKTIAALVLAGLALVFVARWILTSESSPATTAAPISASSAPLIEEKNATQSKRQVSQRSDQKMLTTTWKPSLDPRLELKSLQSSESIEYKGSGRNIFEMTAEPPVVIPTPGAPGRTDARNTPPPPVVQPGPPPPPPINLKFYGFESKDGGQKRVFLSQDGSVFVAKEGDIIARRYKVTRINQSSVEIQDMLSNNKQTIPLVAG
jgi:hypothetical protein